MPDPKPDREAWVRGYAQCMSDWGHVHHSVQDPQEVWGICLRRGAAQYDEMYAGREEAETAVVITVPDTDPINPTQVLVRLPGHIAEENVVVDFRPAPGASWTPSVLFDDGDVEVRHQ